MSSSPGLSGPSTETLTKDDIRQLIREETQFRTGIGYDVHQFAEGRRLILGGVEIAHERGLLGHSDADVVTHAAMDAVLGTDIIAQEGFQVEGLDIMVITEEPKLKPFVPQMKEKLAAAFRLPLEQLGLKATTNEKMGWIGRGEGIACLASALVRQLPPK